MNCFRPAPPPIDYAEVLRYARCRGEEFLPLAEKVAAEMEAGLCYTVLAGEVAVTRNGSRCTVGGLHDVGSCLGNHLAGCGRALLMAATVGREPDRLIRKYADLSPVTALFASALGSERVEALCDAFCREYAEKNGVSLLPRFSPGYGDFPLTAQRELFSALDVTRRLGITLSDSLLMTPTKSVTAVIGILPARNGKENT